MQNEKNPNSEESCLTTQGTRATEIPAGNGSMIVGVSHRLAGMFSREEEECELPADFKARNDDYDWLGVD
jgi:hypothetical protein